MRLPCCIIAFVGHFSIAIKRFSTTVGYVVCKLACVSPPIGIGYFSLPFQLALPQCANVFCAVWESYLTLRQFAISIKLALVYRSFTNSFFTYQYPSAKWQPA